MRQCRKNESGRSMLEVIAIVAIIVFLTLGGMAGYGYLIQKFKRNESADQIEQFVVNVKSSGVAEKYDNGSVISPNTVIAGPKMDKGENRILLPDGGDAAIYALSGSSFKLDVDVQEDTCEALLKFFEEGHSDAVVYMGDGSLGNSDEVNEDGKLVLLRTLTDVQKKAFCRKIKGLRSASFFFECPGGSSSYYYYYDNECHACKKDETLDVAGECCSQADWEHGCGGKCHNPCGEAECTSDDPQDRSGRCVNCRNDGDCEKYNDWERRICTGDECIECTSDSHCSVDRDSLPEGMKNVAPAGHKACIGHRCGCRTDSDCSVTPATPICNQSSHTCVACPNPTEGGGCAPCPENTILHDGECVTCYNPGDGSKPHRGCTSERPICDESRKTGDHAGVCVSCLGDNDCPTKSDKGDKWCENYECSYCEKSAPYHNTKETGAGSCYSCVNDGTGDDQDKGCPLAGGSDEYLCKGTSTGPNRDNEYGNQCFKCYNNHSDGSKDDGCPDSAPICQASDNSFGNACHVCQGVASGTALGCPSSMPICAGSDGKKVAAGQYGVSCGMCINDAEGSNRDTGCTDTKKTMCNGAAGGGVGTVCSECESGLVPCGTAGCVKCCDDNKNIVRDSGCTSKKTMCSDTAGSSTYYGDSNPSNKPGEVCYECLKDSNCALKDPSMSKPWCHDHKCEACPTTAPHWLQVGTSNKYECAMCRDNTAGNNLKNGKTDEECSAAKPLCITKNKKNDGAGELGSKCGECLTSSDCPADKPTCDTSSNTCMKCWANSTLVDGKCLCNKGYTWNSKNKVCSPCAKGSYKDWVGNEACKACDSCTTTSDTGATAKSQCKSTRTGCSKNADCGDHEYCSVNGCNGTCRLDGAYCRDGRNILKLSDYSGITGGGGDCRCDGFDVRLKQVQGIRGWGKGPHTTSAKARFTKAYGRYNVYFNGSVDDYLGSGKKRWCGAGGVNENVGSIGSGDSSFSVTYTSWCDDGPNASLGIDGRLKFRCK